MEEDDTKKDVTYSVEKEDNQEQEDEFDIQKRSQSDLQCIPIFIVMNIALGVIAYHFSSLGGSLERLKTPQATIDTIVNFCGLDNSGNGGHNLKEYKYLQQYHVGVNQTQADGLTYGADQLDQSNPVCVKQCPVWSKTGDSPRIEWFDNVDKTGKNFDQVLDLSNVEDQDKSFTYLTDNFNSPDNFTVSFNGEPAKMMISSVASISGFCVMQIDQNIPAVASIIEALEELMDNFIKSTLSATSGKDLPSQVLTSITSVVDVIMLGFMGASVVGILVLMLFSNEIFVGIIAYVMVLSIDAVLIVGAYIIQDLYIAQLQVQQGNNCFTKWKVDSFQTDFIDLVIANQKDTSPWEAWMGWPSFEASGELCGEDLLPIQALAIGRWVIQVGAVAYTIFVILNFQFINDAIHCIKLAAVVLAQNIILIVQPVQNILLKLVIMCVFMVLISFSLSSSTVSADKVTMQVPDPMNQGEMLTKEIAGISRSFDMMYAMASDDPLREQDVQQMWTEIFMMYWWLALIIAYEQFVTIQCVCLWFFTQKQGQDQKRPANLFCSASLTVLTYHIGSILFGSFLIAVIWTIITMIQVQKEVLKGLMSHEKLEKVRDYLIMCAIWLLMKLKDCVEFGNKLAYMKIALDSYTCFCCATCAGQMQAMAAMGKSVMVMYVTKFFVQLGQIMIMAGGGACTWLILELNDITPITGLSTKVPQPLAPVIFTAAVSQFKAQLFMDIFELCALTFMFVRHKNESAECKSEYGPDATEIKKLEEEIDKQDLSDYGPSKKDQALLDRMEDVEDHVADSMAAKLKAKGIDVKLNHDVYGVNEHKV